MAINFYNANVYKIRRNFGWVRLLGVRFEQSNTARVAAELLETSLKLRKSVDIRVLQLFGGCSRMLEVCLLRSNEKGVRSWRGCRGEFRLAELSRWIVTSYWILWKCAGYLYPDGHVSFQFWARANRIIRRASRAGKLALYNRKLVKTSFEIVLEYF